jgi:hypothetical protein
MKLVHYTGDPLPPIIEIEQQPWQHKPRGLWVSDDSMDMTWPDYVKGTSLRWMSNFSFKHAYEIRLFRSHNVLIMRTVKEIETFVCEFLGTTLDNLQDVAFHPFPWVDVAKRYDGLIITPWEKYTDSPINLLTWHFTWDCASGCIWNPASILSIQKIKVRNPKARR